MPPDRWREIEDLYHAARERGAGVLADADFELRQQVELMLAQDSGDKILDRPIADLLGDSTFTQLTPGMQLGAYRIEGVLGAGGMGRVYRGLDTRLGRPVAIKILHARFSDRFEREARAIAALNHPHICTLYDVGPGYLVMELIHGETLAERLKRGKLATEQLILYGSQIADALAAAHARGIVHRDLKPGNIVLTKSGVKVLDFGLAKSQAEETLTASQAVMGTPAYMAPEQREGKECDPRTDIYALGVLLREMATGNRQEKLDKVPGYLAHVIDRCMASDPPDRWQAASDVKRELEWSPPGSVQWKSSRLPWIAAFAAFAVLVCDLAWHRIRPSSARLPGEFNISLDKQGGTLPVPSPDGRLLAFHGFDVAGHAIIWLRPINSVSARPLSGTEGAGSTIFWSPDGEWIGFYSAGAIKKIKTTGGLPLTIAETSDLQDADWNSQGDIIFRAHNREPLQRVRDSGSRPQPLTRLNPTLLENSHRYPEFLPGGRQFLFVARCADRANDALYIGSLDSPEIQRVMFADARAIYRNGSLIYYRDGALVAQQFDMRTKKPRGDPTVIVEKVGYSPASILAYFNVSKDGSLIVSSPADRVTSRLIWFDRHGQELGIAGPPGPYQQPRISPSKDRILFQMPDPKTGNRDIYFMELGRNIRHRLTNNPANDWFPVWSPDGRQVAFGSDRVDGRTMFAFLKTSLDQGAAETRIDGLEEPSDWSREGWMAGTHIAQPFTNRKIQIGSVHGGERVNLTNTPAWESALRFSPDSRWVAYSSDETGRSEIYVQAFPGHPEPSAARIQISDNGGEYPMWNETGAELYYLSAGDMIFAVDTRTLASGKLAAPAPLFRVCPQSQPGTRPMEGMPYTSPLDTRDGERFVVACLVDRPTEYTVLMNWAGIPR